MLIGRIRNRVLKNVVVVDNGLRLGVEKGADIVSSDSSFED